jgi:hypothetical protein
VRREGATVLYLKEPISTPEEVTREVADTVSQIISEVEREGTTAVRRHSARLDGWDPPSFRVGPDEIEAAYREMEPTVEESGRFLIDQVTNFARLQRETLVDFETETLPGVFLGQRHIPGCLGWRVLARRALSTHRLRGHDGRYRQSRRGAQGDRVSAATRRAGDAPAAVVGDGRVRG